MPPPLTRGPLPASVYWRRRLVVLALAAVLVVSLARLLGGGSDGSDGSADEDGVARQAAAEPTASEPTTSPSPTRRRTPRPAPTQPSTSAAPVLAEPDGPCADSDVKVTPSVVDAIAGRDVVMLLDLRSIASEACTWRVSPTSLTVRIRSGKDAIWSSAQCPRAIPVKDVVVRRDVAATVPLVWDARRSDEECSPQRDWAMSGFYLVAAAALGGEPTEIQFELTLPVPDVVTSSAPGPSRSIQTPTGRPAGGAKPSGAVEPDGPR